MGAAFVILFGALLLKASARNLSRAETTVIWACFAAHVLAAFGHIYLADYYYAFNDMHGYEASGIGVSRLLDLDFARFAPEVVKAAMQIPTHIPELFGEGGSTGSTSAFAALAYYFLGSMTAVCLLTSVAACIAQLSLYKLGRTLLDPQDARAVLLASMLVPSVVFWSGGYTKEALAIVFLGPMAFGARRLIKPSTGLSVVGGVWWVLLGAYGVALIKPYILFPLVVAVATALVARSRRGRGIALGYIVVGFGLAVGGVTALGALFPSYAVDHFVDSTAIQQQGAAAVPGASYAHVGENPESRTLGGQIRSAPLALVNSLFRPALFEVHNMTTFLAALEATVLAILVLDLFWRFRWRRVRAAVGESSALVFCVTFVLLFAVAVGLASPNLGTLSRYRMPMMPFYVALVLVLRGRLRQPIRTHAPRVATVQWSANSALQRKHSDWRSRPRGARDSISLSRR